MMIWAANSPNNRCQRQRWNCNPPGPSSKIFLALPLLFVVVAAGMTANALVMSSIRPEKKHRRLSKYYVFSLACDDFVCGLFVQCPLVVYYVVSSWPFGQFVCRFWVFVDYSTAGVSLMHYILLAYDCYIAEYSDAVRKKYVPYQICFIYIVGALMVPNVLYGSPAEEVADGTCQVVCRCGTEWCGCSASTGYPSS